MLPTAKASRSDVTLSSDTNHIDDRQHSDRSRIRWDPVNFLADLFIFTPW